MGAIPRTHHPPALHWQNWQPLLLPLLGLFSSSPSWACLLPQAGSKKGCKTLMGAGGAREAGRNDNLFLYIFSSFPN